MNDEKIDLNDPRSEAAENQIVEQSKRIEFYLTEFSVELLINKMINEDFYIPEYQRADVWEIHRKCRFIESVLMGLPIPFLFFWEQAGTGKLEIVDGTQRLTTLTQFVKNEFSLEGLKIIDQLNGCRFQDLLMSRRRKFYNRSIRGIVLNENADERARIDLFDRINTGSKIANSAEIRRGKYPGPFMTLVTSLAQNQLFKKLAPVSLALERQREREEFVIRFFAYSDGLENYKDNVTIFLDQYAQRMTVLFSNDTNLIQIYNDRFVTMLNFIERVFPNGFRKNGRGNSTRRARFEAISIGSYLAFTDEEVLLSADITTDTWITCDEFNDIVGSDGANSKSKLIARIDYVKNKLINNRV